MFNFTFEPSYNYFQVWNLIKTDCCLLLVRSLCAPLSYTTLYEKWCYELGSVFTIIIGWQRELESPPLLHYSIVKEKETTTTTTTTTKCSKWDRATRKLQRHNFIIWASTLEMTSTMKRRISVCTSSCGSSGSSSVIVTATAVGRGDGHWRIERMGVGGRVGVRLLVLGFVLLLLLRSQLSSAKMLLLLWWTVVTFFRST